MVYLILFYCSASILCSFALSIITPIVALGNFSDGKIKLKNIRKINNKTNKMVAKNKYCNKKLYDVIFKSNNMGYILSHEILSFISSSTPFFQFVKSSPLSSSLSSSSPFLSSEIVELEIVKSTQIFEVVGKL